MVRFILVKVYMLTQMADVYANYIWYVSVLSTEGYTKQKGCGNALLW